MRCGGLGCGRPREHLIRGVCGRPVIPQCSGAEPSCIAASRGVTSLRPLRPVRAPLVWPRRGRTGGAPLPGARWEGGREGDAVPTARSGRPPCAVRRLRHVLEPIARRVTMGGWLTCWRRCIPLTSRSHGASVQARTGRSASLTPVASLWPSPARGSSAPTSFRVGRRTALRSIITTPRSGALPGSRALRQRSREGGSAAAMGSPSHAPRRVSSGDRFDAAAASPLGD